MRSSTDHLTMEIVRSIGVFSVAFAVYAGVAALTGYLQSPRMAYFDQLADAFLHGRLYLYNPPAIHDLTFHSGRWYVPFPPLAGVLLMPVVALKGIAGTSTVVFSSVMAALNVTLVYLLLQALSARGWSQLRTGSNLWLALLFAFGSVHWVVAAEGTVWHLNQVCAVTFLGLAAWAAARSAHPVLVGAALAFAVAGRPHLILAWPLLAGIEFQRLRSSEEPWTSRRALRWAALSFIPIALGIVALLVYNHARFGALLDFGYTRQHVDPLLAEALDKHGMFHPLHIPRNLWAFFAAIPFRNPAFDRVTPNPFGMSLFLTTPALLYLIRARMRSPLVVGAWMATGLILVVLLLYYNTGYVQFGHRFSLDFMLPVMVLLAVAARTRVSRLMRGLVLLGVGVNAWCVWLWYSLVKPLY
jgi:hypothetical protein